MSVCRSNVCKHLLKEHFGDAAAAVGLLLLKKGACHLRQIASECEIELNKVRQVLTVLIQQNLVSFESNKRGQTEYSISVEKTLWRNRIPHYIHCGKLLYGDAAELLIEELLHHGQATMTDLVDSVTDKLNEALENAGHPKIGASLVYDKFKSLAGTHFIQQCVNPLETVSHEDQDERDIASLFIVPPLRADRKRKASDQAGESSSKKRKTENGDTEDRTYWCVNYQRFHQYFRDQMFVKAVTSKIDKKGGDILQTMLRLCEVQSHDMALTSNPLSFTEVFQAVPRDLGITKNLCEQYLGLVSDDSTAFLSKVGDSGGGTYTVNIYKGLQTLCQAHIESVVQERFGSKSLRIFRVLLLKKHLEQKQIEEMAMIPSKEAKELLYNMFTQGFVSITEISKTPDHAPARTFYLFQVKLEQVARMLLEHSIKALGNVLVKRESETRENRRLMEKQERVEAIVAQSGADEEQKEEILQTITPAEKTQLAKVKHMISMLEQTEVQLDCTIFMLETFLQYFEQKQRLKL